MGSLENYVMEYQVESERGFHTLGSMVYSANTLFPLDPAHFTSMEGEPLGAQLQDYEVPDNSWVWAWSRWYVDMTSDVDDQGWCYSWHFRSRSWSGKHRFMRSFVRQRVWKRPRVRRNAVELHIPEPGHPQLARKLNVHDMEQMLTSGHAMGDPLQAHRTNTVSCGDASLPDEQEAAASIVAVLNSLRNDRERADWIVNRLKNHPDELDTFLGQRDQIIATLIFPISRKALISKLSETGEATCERFATAPSSSWRDQVLLHGEPDPDEDEEIIPENYEQSVPS